MTSEISSDLSGRSIEDSSFSHLGVLVVVYPLSQLHLLKLQNHALILVRVFNFSNRWRDFHVLFQKLSAFFIYKNRSKAVLLDDDQWLSNSVEHVQKLSDVPRPVAFLSEESQVDPSSVVGRDQG